MLQFRLIQDQTEPCPYLPGQVARLPLRMPLTRVSPEAFDRLLAEGHRRSGQLVYRATCPACEACQSLRVPTLEFEPSDSQRRVWKKNEGVISVEMGAPALTREHLALYNRHKFERGLARQDTPLGPAGYRAWLVETCAETIEVRYRLEGRLVAVSILDFGRRSASSVYHYFDPDESRRSLGVYSALKEIDVCRRSGVEWYYLGYYVGDCRALAYKASYFPHERRESSRWVRYDRPSAPLPG